MARILTGKCDICGAPCYLRSRHCVTHKVNGFKPKSVKQRIEARLPKGPGCWEWPGQTNGHGYGRMQIGSMKDGTRRMASVPRLVWEITFGVIPDGLCVLHHCDNPQCCRPEHLFIGTVADNARDMMRKGRGQGQFTAQRVQSKPGH